MIIKLLTNGPCAIPGGAGFVTMPVGAVGFVVLAYESNAYGVSGA